MMFRPFLAAPPLAVLAAAALAAPPLAIPIPRPTPDQEALLIAEAEENQLREEAEEARLREAAALAEPEAAPAPEAVSETAPAPAGEEPAPPVASPVPPAPPVASPVPPAPPVASPVPPAPAPKPASPEPGAPKSANPDPLSATNAVFRRDPFWPIGVARARKADHDARVAAAIEEANRLAELAKIREDALRRGVDVSELDDDQLAALGKDISPEDKPKSRPKSAEKSAGASDEEWDAALARIPPRSGYLGGKRPALMLKGDKRPHYAGDELCVTNRGIVFTWRISSVDFRAYAHDLERVSAKPVTTDRNTKP